MSIRHLKESTAKRTRRRVFAHVLMVVLAFGAMSDAIAQSLRGVPEVIDGDSLRVNGVEVRLHGMDAPELAQKCRGASGIEWACGLRAKQALSEIVGDAEVRCRRTIHHPRYVGDCRVGNLRISAEMLRRGWAVVDRRGSRRYVGDESIARRASRNIWSGSFEKPWKWRNQNESASAAGYVLFDLRTVAD